MSRNYVKQLLIADIAPGDGRAFQRSGRSIRVFDFGGSAPATPDYAGAAKETAAGNLDAARYATQANRPNEITPFGTKTWTNNSSFDQSAYDQAMASYNQALANQQSQQSQQQYYAPTYPGDPYAGMYWNNSASQQPLVAPNAADFYSQGDNWTSNITLSPEMQALFDQQQKLQTGLFGAQDQALGRVNQMMGQGFDMSTIPAAGSNFGSVYDPQKATNNATELLMQRLNPELDRQQSSLEARLANQGITQGSSAYNTSIGQFGQQRNDAATQAALQGIGLGMQQQGLQFNQQNTNQQLQNALRAQALQEQSYLRNLPLNELNALRTGNQVTQPQFGGFVPQATTGGADMLGAAQGTYNANLGAYNANQAGMGNTLGGLFSIGGAMLGAPQSSILGGLLS